MGFQAIKAWADLKGITLRPWQLDAILAMDIRRRQVMSAEQAKTEEPKPVVSKRPLTSKLFDALFPDKRK